MQLMTFTCNSCGESKPTADFYPTVKLKRGHYATCRTCWDKRSRIYRNTHKESCQKTRRKWAESNREKKALLTKKSALKTRYGMTLEGLNSLFLEQNGKCAICQASFAIDLLKVDHCHKTNKIRGLLCNGCNVGLGAFRESPAHLIAAAEFIQASLEALMETA